MDENLTNELVTRLVNQQLVFWIGAGVSMGGESALPSAPALTTECAEIYRQQIGVDLPEASRAKLEAMTEYFYDLGTLDRVFISRIVPWSRFRNGNPNPSHIALADILLTQLAPIVISANYDNRVEKAAAQLGEPDFEASIDISDPAPRQHARYLKIHGCADKDRHTTFWCDKQRNDPPISDRLDRAVQNLPGIVLNMDLVLVGYWTDWIHMYQALCEILEGCEPRRVYVVNPATDEELETLAPELWQWLVNRDHQVINITSDEFFSSLQSGLGTSTLTRAALASRADFQQLFPEFDFPANVTGLPNDPTELYLLRQDTLGVPRDLAIHTNEVNDPIVQLASALVVFLLENGAVFQEGLFDLNGIKIRILANSGLLATIKDRYKDEPEIHQTNITLICAGAIDDGGAAPSVVREDIPGDIMRGALEGTWVTLQEGRQLLVDQCL